MAPSTAKSRPPASSSPARSWSTRLKITQISVKDKTEALFYVQAPTKVDLPGDMTYQYQWVPMIQNARGWYSKGIFGMNDLPGKADDWLKALGNEANGLMQKGQQLGFNFVSGQRPQPNAKGHIATTLEWARKLTADDIKLLKGQAAYAEKVPDVDEGFTPGRPQGPQKGRGGLQGDPGPPGRVPARRIPAATWCARPRPRT